MEECDNFRAVCETTRPSLDYLTPSSRAVLDAVKDLNQESRRAVAAYTHDAGAHIHVFTLTDDLRRVQRELRRIPGVARLLVLRPGPGARPIRGAVSEQG
jgi:mevalonate pyrophosphate decarboxylase